MKDSSVQVSIYVGLGETPHGTHVSRVTFLPMGMAYTQSMLVIFDHANQFLSGWRVPGFHVNGPFSWKKPRRELHPGPPLSQIVTSLISGEGSPCAGSIGSQRILLFFPVYQPHCFQVLDLDQTLRLTEDEEQRPRRIILVYRDGTSVKLARLKGHIWPMLDEVWFGLVVVIAVAGSGVALCYACVHAWKWTLAVISSFILQADSVENLNRFGCRQESSRIQQRLNNFHYCCFAVARAMDNCAKAAQGRAGISILKSSAAKAFSRLRNSSFERRTALGKRRDGAFSRVGCRMDGLGIGTCNQSRFPGCLLPGRTSWGRMIRIDCAERGCIVQKHFDKRLSPDPSSATAVCTATAWSLALVSSNRVR